MQPRKRAGVTLDGFLSELRIVIAVFFEDDKAAFT
jgi:hypothetical protein